MIHAHIHTYTYVLYIRMYTHTHKHTHTHTHTLDTDMLAENQGFNAKGEKIARKDHLYGTGAK